MTSPNPALKFPTDLLEITQKLNDFCESSHLLDYGKTRNYDNGRNRKNVSELSPYIRHGVLTETAVLAKSLDMASYQSIEKYVQEVIWRVYWKGWLEHHPSVWQHFLSQQQADLSTVNANALNSAISAQTSIDCFDAWVLELKETGYLHNHARMWFASIWVFTLGLPWTLGAHFFLQHLKDGCPAANTLSWRWVAGLHTAGKNYQASKSNIQKYTNGQYTAEGVDSSFVPTFDDAAFEKVKIPLPSMTPAALPEMFQVVLTQDNLSTDSLVEALSLARQKSLPVYLWIIKDYDYSDNVWAFKQALAENAITALEQPVQVIRSLDELDQSLPIVMQYPGQGGVLDQITQLNLSQPIYFQYQMIQRILWPYANKGFFQLKRQIPEALKQLGLQ